MRKLLGAIAALAGLAALVSVAFATTNHSSTNRSNSQSVQVSDVSSTARGLVRLGFWTGWQRCHSGPFRGET